MLFCLKLFCLWLALQTGRKKEALWYLEKMHRVPYVIANLLEDKSVKKFSKEITREYAQSKASIVVSAVFSTGAGKEIALKLEENSWSAVSSALDYQEVMETGLAVDLAGVLVTVDATCEPRLGEALEVMELLYRKRVKFAAVGLEGRQEERIRQLSRNRCIFLTGLKENAIQPLVTLVFYYQFTLFYSQFHGIAMGIAPRNLAKSLTAGRNLFVKVDSPAGELLKIKNANQGLKTTATPLTTEGRRSIWEKEAQTKRSRKYYEEMRELAAIISSKQAGDKICRALDENANRLMYYLFDDDSDIDEIVFAPMDRASTAAVKNVARFWSRLLGYPVRIISPAAPLDAFEKNILLFATASTSAGQKRLAKRLTTASSTVFRLEPEADFCDHSQGATYGGKFLLKHNFDYSRGDYLYAAIHSIFIKAWFTAFPEKAEIIDEHFRRSAEAIIEVLVDPKLKAAISTSVTVNRKYETMFYVGPPTGVGLSWTDKINRTGALLCEPHSFGESAHGPLVTVDSKVDAKFVKIEGRTEMLSKFGRQKVVLWEKTYLAEKTIDEFIEAPPADLLYEEKAPFFADGAWYLPELQPDYNTVNDNLIVMDAAWARHLDKTLDEMSTFGSRYSRLILITQQAFLNGKAKEALYRFPVSSTILLPETPTGPISEMHLPFVLNIIGEEFSACFEQRVTKAE
jgi:hypothetical protein